MDRYFAAWLIIAAFFALLAFALVRSRYYSRDNVLKRQRLADAERFAERARRRSAQAEAPDS
jgi:hypothetical protein